MMNNNQVTFYPTQMRKYPQNDLVNIHWLKIDDMGHILQSQIIFSIKILVFQIHQRGILKQIERYLENDLGIKIEIYLESDMRIKIEKYLKSDSRHLPNGLTHNVLWSSLWTYEMFRSHQMMIDMFNGYITFICN